jgi:hypothetical protein
MRTSPIVLVKGPEVQGCLMCFWPELHLTYTAPVALTTEFTLTAGGAQ